MTENPYQPSATNTKVASTRSTRWLVRLGVACLVVALTCLMATFVGMIWAYNSVASSGTTPKPSDLALNISFASIPSMIVVPFAILGIVLVAVGFIIRQPTPDT